MENIETASQIAGVIKTLLATYGLKIIAAILIFVIGRIVANLIKKLVVKILQKNNCDTIVVNFVGNVTYIFLLAFVVLAALGQLGIATTSFIAIIGAAGLAIGLALQGSLANFAAGFLLIIFRPFKVGDYVEAGGTAGIIDSIHIFTTTLLTPDNKVVIVPNAKIAGDNITNYSKKPTRRLDLTFGVGYESDIKKVRTVLKDIIDNDSRVLQDPKPLIVISELADSSVNFVTRFWVKSSDYWPVQFDTIENVKIRFDQEKISIPFPQRDVHLHDMR